jgi:hypothetical protein
MGVTVYFSFDNPGGVRGQPGNAGQINAAYNKLKPLYRTLATELQNETANIIEAERSVREKNPRRGKKGTLAKVTRQRGNIDFGNNGFSVGIHTHLARSQAKYYRIIEEGSAVAAPDYTETMIEVARAKNGKRLWAPRGGAFGTQYPIPAQDAEANDTRRPIEPLYAYRRAWEKMNAENRLKTIWRQLLVDGGLVSKYGPLPKRYQFPNVGKVNY